MSGCHSEAGRLFQILGPATEKLLSPWPCSSRGKRSGRGRTPVELRSVLDQWTTADRCRKPVASGRKRTTSSSVVTRRLWSRSCTAVGVGAATSSTVESRLVTHNLAAAIVLVLVLVLRRCHIGNNYTCNCMKTKLCCV